LEPKIAGEYPRLMEPLGRRKTLEVIDEMVDLLLQGRVLMVSTNDRFSMPPKVFQRIEVGAAGG
jgi:hypothetical protein